MARAGLDPLLLDDVTLGYVPPEWRRATTWRAFSGCWRACSSRSAPDHQPLLRFVRALQIAAAQIEAGIRECLHGLEPLARIGAMPAIDCDRALMGLGPIPATRNALQRVVMRTADVDGVEINEAFSAQG